MCPDSDSKASKTHILSLTYKPKIEAVMAGTCRQTIRRYNPARPKMPGDKLILHTWQGKPYRSPWGFRLETAIKDVVRLRLEDYFQDGTLQWVGELDPGMENFVPIYPEAFAELDGIVPATREGLESTLKALNGLDTIEGVEWEVIRW